LVLGISEVAVFSSWFERALSIYC